MTEEHRIFSKLPASLHFVGAGGIGMSGLAQLSAALGIRTTGSDRAASAPENARIFHALERCGVKIFPQDGSVYRHSVPEALVYSTAIEDENPDFLHAPAGTERLHRSAAMELLVRECDPESVIAVAGTCGKTSVTAQLAEALFHLNADPRMLCGGLVNSFVSETSAGNFRNGSGPFVLEADESDRSLLNYTADTAVVLNIGTDHYPKKELAEIFRKFIANTKSNVVLAASVLDAVGTGACRSKETLVFSEDPAAPEGSRPGGFPVLKLNSCRIADGRFFCSFDGMPEIRLRTPGRHNALNAMAVYAVLLLHGFEREKALRAAENFSGVWRRFDLAGSLPSGAALYDDYAHNTEKILSSYETAKSLSSGQVYMIFQPHGYKPFGFMREELFQSLEHALRPGDVFGFLPVYYAGGTSSFRPSSEETVSSFRKRSGTPEHYEYFPCRKTAEEWLNARTKRGDVAVILGARDNSLSLWAKKIARGT